MTGSLTEAMAKVLEVLTPLESDERKRVVQAAFALLGEEVPSKVPESAPKKGNPGSEDLALNVSPAAAAWLTKMRVTKEQLEQCVHFEEGKVTVIALPGGATKRIDQVVHTYLMQGFAAFLAGGEGAFTDKDARELCEHFGCYDQTNHAKYLKEFGNRITGSKSTGWKLTAPGLAAAAELVRG